MTQHHQLTADRLREVLEYDPGTGSWVWLVTLGNRAPKGSKAGSPSIKDGWVIRIDTCLYKAHRLAVLYMTGDWPADQVDHEDVDQTDGRWDNLRPADNWQNSGNRHVRSDSGTGVKGVFRINSKKNPFEARIKVGGKVKILGYFPTTEEASVAYEKAAKAVFGEFARAA